MGYESGKIDFNNLSAADVASLTPEQRAEYKRQRTNNTIAARNQALTDSISGVKEKLEEDYIKFKAKKDQLIIDFNNLHSYVVGELHPNYTFALENRAEKGWARLYSKDIFKNSSAILNSTKKALQTGDYSHLNYLPLGMNEHQTQSYVYNQSLIFGKQNETDSENYQLAQLAYNNANNATHQADRTLIAAIDEEGEKVDNMKLLDEQLRMNTIAQNSLDSWT